ncbi:MULTISPECIES: factor-independent urate hydroxylase [unclassified Solwaraspora]|uniref:factor-independent urate hydroxylase n=1 Tax=unclassified Solwaraspora TaxID=2627926 RepID=UPI00259BAA19|nr:urate oxidase [Solwaraspora sp. WMMA2056]WJK38768.1 urate oxidase [Solwaraspora sp. WMMA2056]
MGIVLGPNRYGKAETRVVRVDRDADRHTLTDLTVSVALAGDLAATHLTGDNRQVLPTDTQKNTVYAFARQHGIASAEEFGLLLARHFVDSQASIDRARVDIAQHDWHRLGPHSFARDGGHTRTVTVRYDGQRAEVTAGLTGLVLLNSTDSEFRGYVVDPYTTLPETDDRILATAVDAQWRYAGTEAAGGFDAAHADVRRALIDAFVGTYSRSLQQTLYAMGERVLTDCPDVVQVRLALPNKHHLPVDLDPFGLDNPGTVFVATDRPYGLIEGTVARDDAPPALGDW